MNIYDDYVDAMYHIDDCKEKLESDFKENKDSRGDLKNIWY